MASSAWKIIPQFPAKSINATVDFYENDLHFKIGGVATSTPGEEANFCSVFIGAKAEANIYFLKSPNKPGQSPSPGSAMIALGTKQLDEYYSLLQRENRVKIVEPVEDKPWGFRQFSIEDLDGNKLTFFKFLEGGNPGGPNGTDLSETKHSRA